MILANNNLVAGQKVVAIRTTNGFSATAGDRQTFHFDAVIDKVSPTGQVTIRLAADKKVRVTSRGKEVGSGDEYYGARWSFSDDFDGYKKLARRNAALSKVRSALRDAGHTEWRRAGGSEAEKYVETLEAKLATLKAAIETLKEIEA